MTATPTYRRAVRVITIRPDDRVLLICGEDPASRRRVWVMPGGGIEAGETIPQAAARELWEETGIERAPETLTGPIWRRAHEFSWNDVPWAYEESFLVARLDEHPVLRPFHASPQEAAGAVDIRWASVAELGAWPDPVAPRRLAELLPDVLAGQLPAQPIDVGI